MSSRFHHTLHIPCLRVTEGSLKMGLKVKRKRVPCLSLSQGIVGSYGVGCGVALSSLSSMRIHFSFPNYNIYLSSKNIIPAIVLPCDTQAAEHSPCHTVTAVSSLCPYSVLPPVALGSQLPWWILRWQLLVSFPPSQPRVLAQTPKAGMLTHLCHLLFCSLGSGSGIPVAVLHRRTLKPQHSSSTQS